MRIGIIGAGNVGGTLAGLFLKAGHEVMIANSRGPESLAELVVELGDDASAGSVAEVVESSDVVVEANPFGKVDTRPAALLAGKVLITASNYYPGRDGEIELGELSQREYLAQLLPATHIAKVFNTIYWEHLLVQGDTSRNIKERRVLPFAASDGTAESVARELILELGFGPLFLGNLAQPRGVSEPDGILYNKKLTLTQAEHVISDQE